MTEREVEFQRDVESLLRARPSLLWHHCRDARHCSGWRGLPDLVVVGANGVAWRELKLDATDLSGPQRRWRWGLLAAGADFRVWRPGDLDLIKTDLDRLTRRVA